MEVPTGHRSPCRWTTQLLNLCVLRSLPYWVHQRIAVDLIIRIQGVVGGIRNLNVLLERKTKKVCPDVAAGRGGLSGLIDLVGLLLRLQQLLIFQKGCTVINRPRIYLFQFLLVQQDGFLRRLMQQPCESLILVLGVSLHH